MSWSTEGARTWLKDGHSVSLKIQKQELAKFKSDQGEGFGKVQ
jgi:hypothetical protein